MTKRNADSMPGWSLVVLAPPGSLDWTRYAGCCALAPRSPTTEGSAGYFVLVLATMPFQSASAPV